MTCLNSTVVRFLWSPLIKICLLLRLAAIFAKFDECLQSGNMCVEDRGKLLYYVCD